MYTTVLARPGFSRIQADTDSVYVVATVTEDSGSTSTRGSDVTNDANCKGTETRAQGCANCEP